MTASHFIHIFFCLCFIIFYCLFGFILFRPLYLENCVIFTHSVHPFDLCYSYPLFWSIFKICFIIIYFLCAIIYSKLLDSFIFSKIKIAPKIIDNSSFCLHSSKELSLKIGINSISQQSIFLSSSSLYQNILITGTIGTGKTSSAIFPFSKQFIQYESQNPNLKLSILCLDVKGNLIYQIQKYVKEHHRENDLIILSPESSETYNPLDKPNLSPFVLAHRLKTILTLFSPNNTESYWLDKVEQILAEAIKLCRLSHNNYITFLNIHKFITDKEYYYAQLNHLRNLFHQNHFSNSEIYDLLSGIEFFEKEFYELDDRTQSILKSEVSRITNYFVSNYTLSELFCPKASQISFHGFKEVLEKGKIVVFSMNVAEYKNVAKILATYLKLDFQSEILQQLKLKEKTTIRSSCFICDEYQEYITSTDSDFFSQSREAKCINIISTQSYSSLLNSLNNKHSVNVIIQSLVNKLWFRSDDIYTIESAQKQIGKEEKRKTSTTISENAKETNYSYLTKKFHSQDSNISESINIYYQDDFIFHTNFFTQQLETFSCVAFLSDGNKILPPTKLKMFPYFIH